MKSTRFGCSDSTRLWDNQYRSWKILVSHEMMMDGKNGPLLLERTTEVFKDWADDSSQAITFLERMAQSPIRSKNVKHPETSTSIASFPTWWLSHT
jgi:hypothetical protein